MLVSERISDTSVEDEIEDADVRVCWDAGVGEDRDEIKIGKLGVKTLVLECVDESNSEIWDWRHKIEIGIALRRDLERKIEIEGVVENFDGNMRSSTRSGWQHEGDNKV